MAFNARVYRILIASPSDVSAEREIAVRAIQEWNDRNAVERAVTLLPIRWETHSTPRVGERPQGIINREIVDDCDALVGIFWTRIGTHTGVAESGTLEEIERTVNAGKAAMLYFSSAPQNPDTIDTLQLTKLREFKKSIQNRGLIQSYSSTDEFKDLLLRHLESQVRILLSEEGTFEAVKEDQLPRADVQVQFDGAAMKLDSLSPDGLSGEVSTTYTEVEAPETIPDLVGPTPIATEQTKGVFSLLGSASMDNANYYREVAAFLRDGAAFRKLCLINRNIGSIGARDVYFDIEVSSDKPITVANESSLVLEMPSKSHSWAVKKKIETPTKSESWKLQDDVGPMQPQRTIDWSTNTFIAAWEDCTVRIDVTIYADILAVPTRRSLELRWKANRNRIDVDVFMDVLNPAPDEEVDPASGSS